MRCLLDPGPRGSARHTSPDAAIPLFRHLVDKTGTLTLDKNQYEPKTKLGDTQAPVTKRKTKRDKNNSTIKYANDWVSIHVPAALPLPLTSDRAKKKDKTSAVTQSLPCLFQLATSVAVYVSDVPSCMSLECRFPVFAPTFFVSPVSKSRQFWAARVLCPALNRGTYAPMRINFRCEGLVLAR